MSNCAQPLADLDELRNFVNAKLCENDFLEVGAFQLTERLLTRNDRPCGIFYCLHGPRSVKYTAIWETDRNTVLFYDATGQRFLKVQLMAAPALRPVAA